MRKRESKKTAHHLVSQEQHSLEGEFPVTKAEEVLQAGSEQVHHHHIVVALNPKPANIGHSNIGACQTNSTTSKTVSQWGEWGTRRRREEKRRKKEEKKNRRKE